MTGRRISSSISQIQHGTLSSSKLTALNFVSKLTSSLIAHPKDRVSTLQDVQTLPFFQKTKFSALRETTAPFVPMLDGETDVGYFDSFESAEDMAKYAEVFKKQRDVEAVQEKGLGKRNNWVRSSFPLSLFL